MEDLPWNINHPDTLLAHRCRTGFRTTGEADTTNVFRTKTVKEFIQGADPLTWSPQLAPESRRLRKESIEAQEVVDVTRDLYHTTTSPKDGEVVRG